MTPRILLTRTGRPLCTANTLRNVYPLEILKNRTLQTLLAKYENGSFKVTDNAERCSSELNSVRSLPMVEFPKARIASDVHNDGKIKNWRKPLVQWYRIGVHLVKYYKTGIQNTYKVYRDTKNVHTVDLVKKTFKDIEFIETKRIRNNEASITPSSLLTRKVFAECDRRDQFWKLPTFFVTAILLEEFTALLCYFYPSIAPHNCLMPNGFMKISKKFARKGALPSWPPKDYLSPYTIDRDAMYELISGLKVSKVGSIKLKFYKAMRLDHLISEELTRCYQYLFVDDWMLLNSILKQETTILHDSELVNIILERQLYKPNEDINKLVCTPDGKDLLVKRVFVYWSSRFEKSIPGQSSELFSTIWGVNNIAILNHPGPLLLDANSANVLSHKQLHTS